MSDLPSILELLDLEYIEEDIYRSCLTFNEPHTLFGGQVAAQALYAAGKTVPGGRLPHSLHGYFLRAGDTRRPTLFRVDRDRDGGASSARRVVAIQNGEVIFNMAASFTRPRVIDEPLLDRDAVPIGSFPAVDDLPSRTYPRHPSFEFRHEASPHRLPERFWIRCLEPLPSPEQDPLLHAAVLTYISDISTGLILLEPSGYVASSSIDHAVWLPPPGPDGRLDLAGHAPGDHRRGAWLVHRRPVHPRRHPRREHRAGSPVQEGSQDMNT